MNAERRRLPIRLALAAALLTALAVAGLFLRYRATAPPGPATSEERSEAGPPSLAGPDRPGCQLPSSADTDSSPAAVSPPNGLQRILDENGEGSELPPEAFERWLASGRTNAGDLLAVRQAGGGEDYLRRALTNFPNDPRVLFAALALRDAPEVRRERLDRFQAAAPDNALADYLSARDHFQNARPEQGVADLLAATGKTRFEDYTLDAMQNAEELYLLAGKSPAEAKALGGSTTLLPHLAQLKGLATNLLELEHQYQAAGDAASAENAAQMGMRLGEQLSGGEGSRFLINQLVGTAVEKIVLRALDGQQSPDFLQSTVSDYLGRVELRRAEVRQDAAFLNAWILTATEPDLISYFDRVKLFGESAAVAWLRRRQGGP